jgi:hypothetical protein
LLDSTAQLAHQILQEFNLETGKHRVSIGNYSTESNIDPILLLLAIFFFPRNYNSKVNKILLLHGKKKSNAKGIEFSRSKQSPEAGT